MIIAIGITVFNVFVIPYSPASLLKEDTAIEASVVNSVKKSIVTIHSAPSGIRSGLVLNTDGFIVTLYSVVKRKSVLLGYFGGDQVSLKNLYIVNDGLALLKMTKSGNIPTVGFADEKKIETGQKVFLVASASLEQDKWIVEEGSISQVSDEIITTDIMGYPEISSSPMFNAAGELVGIAYLDVNGKISAVPVNKVRAFKSL